MLALTCNRKAPFAKIHISNLQAKFMNVVSDPEASRLPRRNRLLHGGINCQSILGDHNLTFLSLNAKACGKNGSKICTKTAKTQVCAICFRHLKMTWNDYWLLILHVERLKGIHNSAHFLNCCWWNLCICGQFPIIWH